MRRFLALLQALLATACAGSMPEALRRPDAIDAPRPCPGSPNCVTTHAGADDDHKVAPIIIASAPDAAWAKARGAVAGMERTRIVFERPPRFLHAECSSAVFGFVDDLELLLSADDEGTRVDLRSASRVGHSDLGVNRERAESLRKLLVTRPP